MLCDHALRAAVERERDASRHPSLAGAPPSERQVRRKPFPVNRHAGPVRRRTTSWCRSVTSSRPSRTPSQSTRDAPRSWKNAGASQRQRKRRLLDLDRQSARNRGGAALVDLPDERQRQVQLLGTDDAERRRRGAERQKPGASARRRPDRGSSGRARWRQRGARPDVLARATTSARSSSMSRSMFIAACAAWNLTCSRAPKN